VIALADAPSRHTHFISITIQEFIKKHQQIPNCEFLKTGVFMKANSRIYVASLKV